MSIQHFESGPRMSQAVACDGFVFLAGQIAKNPTPSATDQTRQILAEIDRLLSLAGSSKDKVLSATIWLTDMANYQAFNEIWDAWIVPPHPPARACIQAQLARKEWLVEVQVTALRID